MSVNARIVHDPENKQFYVVIDGARAYLAYMDLGKQTLDIYRTYVPDILRGQGVAAKLTEHALQFARIKGYTVIPSCSYVERYMERQAGAAERAKG
ncbi:MAG TPA: N-acetyltransferase [Pseudomonas xinjiangensis]|uniref:N-acetyltransferase n=2 Tax=root TaxID=1 RepID=A0A7V1BQF6_9GAMM|nr:N-acetyltransferase [Halopseudomonas xinjiangensis]HEC48202.1 N-acetyltransferase [Halopseudomonas xinjiangensis]